MTKQGNHTSEILKLGTPIMLGQMGVILVGFIDNIMVGQYGTQELAAASFVNGFINIAFVFAMGFSYGLTPLASGSFATHNGKLKTLLKSSTLLNLLMGLLITLAMWICLVNIHWFKQPEELLPLIKPYYTIHLVSIVPLIIFYGYKQFVDGTGNTKVGMMAIIISNVINIIFNYLLIFGKLGFPELGLIGAGLSTFLSRLVMLAILIFTVHSTKRFKSIFEVNRATTGKIERDALQRLGKIGMPSALQLGMETASFSIAVIMVGWIGTIQLAAHQIVNTVSTLGFLMYYGMSAAVMIRVGRFYELKETKEIKGVVQAGFKIQIIMALILMAFLLLFRRQIPKIFTSDIEVIELAALVIFPLTAYQISDVLQILFSNALRGLQDVKFTAWAAAFCYLGLTISMAYVFGFVLDYGIVGIWSAFIAGFSILSALLIYRYRKVLRKLEEDIQGKSIKGH